VNLQKGQLDEALELFEQHLDPETASPEMIRAASLANLQKNRPEEALRILREAAKDRPNDADVLAVYGLTALSIPGAEEDGLLALQKAIAQSPEKVNLRVALADYYFRKNLPEQALAQLQTASEAAPGNFVVQRAYVGALLRQGNTAQARIVTSQLQETVENEAFVWLLSAQVSMASQDFAAALQQLTKAAALAPREPAPLLGLAQLALQQREWNNAARYFERAADLRPDLDQAYKGIITAHESAQTVEQGLARLKELSKDAAKAPTANAVLAHYYVLNGKPEEARELADQAVAGASDNRYVRGVAAQTYRTLAEKALSAGDPDQARRLLVDALELIPNSLPLLSQLAALEIDTGQLEEAEKILARMETGAAGAQSAALLRAVMLNKQGQWQEALALLDQQWERSPTPDLGNHRYMLIKQHNGDPIPALQAWAERFPQDVRPLTFLGMEAQAQGNNDDARDYYQRALVLNGNNALVLNNLAWLEFEAGSDNAVELARRAADLAPNNPAVLDTYGWILVQRGQRDEGLRYLERAASAAPDNAEIQAHLESARSQG
ncbi:MAG: tetratricopeptide repeat protein, partial [Spongiibacteraceae bacterium]|nr:tetratricopeptide repeat protein [Spongiibacteraceae bacterium]